MIFSLVLVEMSIFKKENQSSSASLCVDQSVSIVSPLSVCLKSSLFRHTQKELVC